jgi:hypothetical protein
MIFLWNTQPCSLVEVDRRFRGACASIALIMEAVRISETSIYFNETTRRFIPEGCHRQHCIPFLRQSSVLRKAKTEVVAVQGGVKAEYNGSINLQTVKRPSL